MPLFLALVGVFLAGVLTMGWIKSFQVQSLEEENDQLRADLKKSNQNQASTVEASNAIVNSERRISDAASVPGPGGLGLLLGDAKVRSPSGPSGKT